MAQHFYIQALLDYGAHIRTRGQTGCNALHCAAMRQKKEAAKLLLAKGAELFAQNNYGETAMHLALENTDTDIALHILETSKNTRQSVDINKGNPHCTLQLQKLKWML